MPLNESSRDVGSPTAISESGRFTAISRFLECDPIYDNDPYPGARRAEHTTAEKSEDNFVERPCAVRAVATDRFQGSLSDPR